MAYIQANKVQKLVKESGILGKKVTKTDVDILFAKVNKSKPNMSFEDFIKLLYEFAKLKYGGDEMEAFQHLLKDSIFKKFDEIGGNTAKPKELEYDPIVNEVFENIINLTYDIYHSYFTFRIDKVDKATTAETQRCEKFMYEFLRDFEICPKILSKSKVYAIWTYALECSKAKKEAIYTEASKTLSKNYDIKEENKLFTFAYFLDFIVLLSYEAFKKAKALGKAEPVVMLLESMEKSEGFCNFEGKMHRTQSSSSSLLPPESVYKKLSKRAPEVEDSEETKEKNISKILSGKAPPLNESSKVKEETKTKGKLAPKKEEKKRKLSDNAKPKKAADEDFDAVYSDEVKELVPQIKKVFAKYCAYGDKGNTKELKGSMFQKLLKDAKIIK